MTIDSAASDGVVVGVDIGGTKVLAGVVGSDGRVTNEVHRATPGRRVGIRQVEDTLVEAVLAAADNRPLIGVGVAAAGLVDAAGERVTFAPHLPWTGEPLREVLAARLGCRVVLDNDANCAALAESRYGAARGAECALMITMGTGIGGAVLLAGQVFRGVNGMAGEFGHMQVVPDGQSCECGLRGCWEQYCSGNALERYARSRIGQTPTVLAELCAGNSGALTGPMVTAAAQEGDLVALEAFGDVGEWLGVGLANLVAAFDPDLVVIGGGVSIAGDRLLEPARRAFARRLLAAPNRVVPTLVPATLGVRAGVIGAGEMVGCP